MIMAINMYLHAYHMYRAAALNKLEVKRLDTKSRYALDTLQKEFPYGVRRADGTLHQQVALRVNCVNLRKPA